MEMSMLSSSNTQLSQDLTPPIPPLAFSLYTSFLSSHCSSCALPSSTTPLCSTCSSLPLSLLNSSAESETHLLSLLHNHPSLFPFPDDYSSELRLSLRLLSLLPPNPISLSPRLLNLLTNREKLLSNEKTSARVRAGARVIKIARANTDFDFDCGFECQLEEAVLCLVLTNAVEININGGQPVGIAVYDWRFSWINHSCLPNSCYRFVSAFDDVLNGGGGDGGRSDDLMRIVPCCGGEVAHIEGKGIDVSTTSELARVQGNYGPRIVVRSIKGIQRGEEVTVTYTDLLQPTTLRQSELWLRYQFICSCKRCCSLPQIYVDRALQETFSAHPHNNSPRTLDNHIEENVIEKLRDVFDSTVMEYMEVGDPVSCCEKIEGLFSQGLFNNHFEQTQGVNLIDFRLSPLHHLSLSAYTTLHSTYKIRAREFIDGKRLHSFDMSRISVAYSLLLAGATHHLFLFETSLIASAATFWTNAGESLLSLAKSSEWNLFKSCMSQNPPLMADFKCPGCLLMDKFQSNFSSIQDQNREFHNISQDFFACISIITPKVWSFLVQGCQYLRDVKDPIDFSWLGALRTSDICEINAKSQLHRLCLCNGVEPGGKLLNCDDEEPGYETRSSVIRLGVHCLLYGGYLSHLCYGHNQYSTYCIQNVLRG